MSSEVETSLTVSVAKRQHRQTILRDSSTSVGMTKRLFGSLDVYHDESSRPAAMNMAIDEALLEIANEPTIRFYRWDHPAISFGYFGRFADVENHSVEHDIVRRWTGGGIVFHGEDLTYSIVIPANDPAFGESSMSIYEKVHRAIRDALNANGTVAALASPILNKRQSGSDQHLTFDAKCFANPVRADVLLNGRKIAGAAQRRTRRGLLQQGSIQDVDLAEDFECSLMRELAESCREQTISERIVLRAREIADRKYATEAWSRRR